jgi:hypothetical protein
MTLARSPCDNRKKGGESTKRKWADALEMAKAGDFDSIDPHIQLQYHSTLRKIRNETLLQQPQIQGDLENLWYHGAPGTGKSLCARTRFPHLFLKALNHWWDGYEGEETVLIEEWEVTSGKFLGHHLKIWSDRYPFKPEIKGSSLPPQRPRRIVVTSNYSLQECFGADATLLQALRRRFTEVDFDAHPFAFVEPAIISPDRQPDDFS